MLPRKKPTLHSVPPPRVVVAKLPPPPPQKKWEALKFCITVDGTAASGKSAIARRLATRFSALHINSGLYFRFLASTFGHPLKTEWERLDDATLLQHLKSLDLTYSLGSEYRTEIHFRGELVTEDRVASEEIAHGASVLACRQIVRDYILELQLQLIHQHPRVVLEGRDAGSVVAPSAPVKLFIDADVNVRAERRLMKLRAVRKSEPIPSVQEIESQLTARDTRDRQRQLAPLVLQPDMIFLDNSKQDIRKSTSLARQMVEQHFGFNNPEQHRSPSKLRFR